ncbi:DUF6508 domain-containing protein [Terribacillus saccharophilus]|uniref:DUF6508 domain-containing protein n=1 Tax=Terribacillus saccharophilus TaxID=361277 RepID=UPI002989E9C1|nr:DUF6508 domain-containing protein [Terribacillus saccharophilus]MCM3227366.1 DUF6508 domain-containing protein [Terribacillus saccharophilus]
MTKTPNDTQLTNELDRSNTDAWAELRAIVEEMTDEDRHVKWTHETNVFSYPIYSERINKSTNLLYTVGAITPLYSWMTEGLPDYSPTKELSPADAIRAATYIVRSERFADGAIAKAAEIGLLDSILHSLIRWYDSE